MNLLRLLGALLALNWKVTRAFSFEEEFLQEEAKELEEWYSGADTEDIVFKLYNKDIPEGVYISNDNSTEHLKSLFRPGMELKMVCHGWLGSENTESSLALVTAYLSAKDVNVISVGVKAMRGSRPPFIGRVLAHYTEAAKSVKASGEGVASMIDHLLDAGVTTLDTVHLIGFSLGGHIVGAAGSSVSKGKIARVTGLDPAGPLFENLKDPSEHLDRNDAHFVDVIHTNARTFGIARPLGHVDFYPNNGRSQPGCPFNFSFEEIATRLGCNHYRAYKLFAESIQYPKAFPSDRDGVTAFMGDGVDQTASGVFYPHTNEKPPYGVYTSK